MIKASPGPGAGSLGTEASPAPSPEQPAAATRATAPRERRDHLIASVQRFGFPIGAAATQRVRLITSAFARAGTAAEIHVTRPSEEPDRPHNRAIEGAVEGVAWRYTCGRTDRPRGLLRRKLAHARGFWSSAARCFALAASPRRRVTCYLYDDDPRTCVPMALIARLIGARVLYEQCEWRPALSSADAPLLAYYRHLRFRLGHGVLAISRLLAARSRAMAGGRAAVITLPILADPEPLVATTDAEDGPIVLWCGSLDAYFESVATIVQAFAAVHRHHPGLRLRLAGPARPASMERLNDLLRRLLPDADPDTARHLGFIDRTDLLALMGRSCALLAPLEDDERSRARFPTKIGEYLASGRPVVTNPVGDVPLYLHDGVDALFYRPDDPESLASVLTRLAADGDLVRRIGAAGAEIARRRFDPRNHVGRLRGLLDALHRGPERRLGRRLRCCFVADGAYPVLAEEDHGSTGGAQVQQALLGHALVRAGCEVSFVVGDYGQAPVVERGGIAIHRCPFRYLGGSKRHLPTDTLHLLRVIARIKPDVVVFKGPPDLAAGLALVRVLTRGRLILLLANDRDCMRRPLSPGQVAYRLGLPRIDRLVFQTPLQRRLAAEHLLRRGPVIPNIAHAAVAPTDAPPRYDGLWVGTSVPHKRPEAFLELAAALPDRRFCMIAVPSPDDPGYTQAIAERAAALPNVEFRGFVPYHEVTGYFAASRVLIHTSLQEGFSNVCMQAWQHAVPVIAAAFDPDGVVSRFGLGIVAGNVAAMTAAAGTLLADEERRRRMGERGRRYVANVHDANRIARLHRTTYTRVAGMTP